MTKQKLKPIIWKYRNGDYVSAYWRCQLPDGQQSVQPLNDKQTKALDKYNEE